MENYEVNYNKTSRFCNPGKWVGWVILGIVGVTAFAFLFGAVVMWLWNWLMPVLFHLSVITYWQAVGLAILARLLFGSFHHGGSHPAHHHKSKSWNYKYHGGSGCCGEKDDRYIYDQYWKEVGEKSFQEYVEKKKEPNIQD